MVNSRNLVAPLTFTEENYLKAIHSIGRAGVEEGEAAAASVNAIAERVCTKPATVTDMLRKLSEKGLISYEKYRPVQLTDTGLEAALTVVRKHRLWETFLEQTLGFRPDEVHEVAEQLEHIQSRLLIDRLDKFLGYPQVDPHGEEIPRGRSDFGFASGEPFGVRKAD